MTPNERELLTLAIDGELSPADARNARRLIQESPEAKAYYLQLKKDSASLRGLKTVKIPVDLSASILQKISDDSISPIPAPPTRKRPQRAWFPMAIAASVLLFITGVSTYIFQPNNKKETGQGGANLAKNQAPRSSNTNTNPTHENATTPSEFAKILPPVDISPITVPEVIVRADAQPKEVEVVSVPPREITAKDVITFPVVPQIPDIRPAELDRMKLTKFFETRELLKETEQAKLLTALQRDKLIRLDLFTKSNPKSLELIQNALKAQGVTLTVDSFVADRLKKNQPTEILVYTESLTAEQVQALILSAIKLDTQASSPTLDTLFTIPFEKSDLEKLSQVMGVPASQLNIQPSKIIKPASPTSLEQGTANTVAGVISKSPTKGEPLAIGVGYFPVNPNAKSSKEIASFFEKRGDRKPENRPLMLVIKAAP